MNIKSFFILSRKAFKISNKFNIENRVEESLWNYMI